MRVILCLLLALCLLPPAYALAGDETTIVLSDEGINIDGVIATTDAEANVYISTKVETHGDVSDELKQHKQELWIKSGSRFHETPPIS